MPTYLLNSVPIQSAPRSCAIDIESPSFDGIVNATSRVDGGMDIQWNSATDNSSIAWYEVYIGQNSTHLFSLTNRIVTTASTSTTIYTDANNDPLFIRRYYVGVRCVDVFGNRDTNSAYQSLVPTGNLGTIQANLQKAMGLVHQNIKINQITYDEFGRRTSAKITTYGAYEPNKVIGKYIMTAAYNDDKLSTYKVVEEANVERPTVLTFPSKMLFDQDGDTLKLEAECFLDSTMTSPVLSLNTGDDKDGWEILGNSVRDLTKDDIVSVTEPNFLVFYTNPNKEIGANFFYVRGRTSDGNNWSDYYISVETIPYGAAATAPLSLNISGDQMTQEGPLHFEINYTKLGNMGAAAFSSPEVSSTSNIQNGAWQYWDGYSARTMNDSLPINYQDQKLGWVGYIADVEPGSYFIRYRSILNGTPRPWIGRMLRSRKEGHTTVPINITGSILGDGNPSSFELHISPNPTFSNHYSYKTGAFGTTGTWMCFDGEIFTSLNGTLSPSNQNGCVTFLFEAGIPGEIYYARCRRWNGSRWTEYKIQKFQVD